MKEITLLIGLLAFTCTSRGTAGAAYVQSDEYAWRLLLPRQAFTVQVNPLDPQKLYVGNKYDQLWRSNDGGVLWERIVLNDIQTDQVMSSMIVSSADTNVLLFGGFVFDGIKRSEDGGYTVTQALPDTVIGLRWFVSEAIIEDPSNPQILYAAQGRTKNSVYQSVDVGKTWRQIAVIDTAITKRLCTIAIRPDSTNILFVGATRGTIIRSDDSGQTWRQVPVLGQQLKIKPSSEIPKIVFSPRDPMVGYAVVAFNDGQDVAGNGGVLKTTNGGASWDRIAFADTSLWAVEVRTSSSGTDDVFVGGFRLSDIQTAIRGDSLIYRSLDGGNTWTRLQNINWRQSLDPDTMANVWVLRYHKAGNKLYMAANTGLYVFDEPVGVREAVQTHASLRANITNDVLHVVDTEPRSDAATWTLYDLQGAAVAQGHVGSSNEVTLHLSRFASGSYLMTWGDTEKFRVVRFNLNR